MTHNTLVVSLAERAAGTEQRATGRVHVCGLLTPLGEAMDVSGGGLRVMCPSRPPRVGTGAVMTISGVDGSVEVGVRVAWTRRVEGGHEVGLAFMELTPDVSSALRRLMLSARVER